jgi:hypothetical protein
MDAYTGVDVCKAQRPVAVRVGGHAHMREAGRLAPQWGGYERPGFCQRRGRWGTRNMACASVAGRGARRALRGAARRGAARRGAPRGLSWEGGQRARRHQSGAGCENTWEGGRGRGLRAAGFMGASPLPERLCAKPVPASSPAAPRACRGVRPLLPRGSEGGAPAGWVEIKRISDRRRAPGHCLGEGARGGRGRPCGEAPVSTMGVQWGGPRHMPQRARGPRASAGRRGMRISKRGGRAAFGRPSSACAGLTGVLTQAGWRLRRLGGAMHRMSGRARRASGAGPGWPAAPALFDRV